MKKAKNTHSIKEQERLVSKFSEHILEIKTKGFTVVPNLISKKETKVIRKKILEIYKKQCAEINGEKKLSKIYEQGFTMSLLSYDKYFVKFVTQKKYTRFVKSFLGNYFQLFCQNGVINQANRKVKQNINKWHRDFNYLHIVSSKPLGLNIFYCVDDFTESNGSTWYLPGSHKFEKFPGLKFAEKHKVQIIAKAGSAIVFDPMVFHKGGLNKSKKERITFTNIFTYPFIKQQINLPQKLETKTNSKVLGFYDTTANSVYEFRKKRLLRISQK